jgi:hypothetical protein
MSADGLQSTGKLPQAAIPVLEHLVVPPTPSVSMWLRVRRSSALLDRRLAGGADPGASVTLAVRSRQLTDRRMRRRFARDLEQTVDRLSLRSLRPLRPVRVEAVVRARCELFALAVRLQDDAQPAGVRGMRW